jgi:DNA-binding NarL/FixJ family response regulator
MTTVAAPGATSIAVGIVADTDVLREALTRVIGDDSELTIVGTARDTNSARMLLRDRSMQVLVVNLALAASDRRASGLDFIAEVKQTRSDVRILSLKRGVEEALLRAAIDAGADACCLSGAPRARLVRAIKAVSVGGTWLDPELSDIVFRSRKPRIAMTPRLTAREREVLQLLTEGLTNAEIAAALKCSAGTVHTHVANVFSKLNVRDRVSAAVYALRCGLISEDVIL